MGLDVNYVYYIIPENTSIYTIIFERHLTLLCYIKTIF